MHTNRLFNLFAANAKKGSFLAEGNTIYVYDVIVGSDAEAEYWGGVSPQAFAKALKSIKGAVELRINSPGGDVFGARAMATAMREHDGEITAHVDGYAASAASLIAISANKTVMAEGSMMMIHKAWTFAMGNADDLTSRAALLSKIDDGLAETYASKSGGNAEDFAKMMAEETWFSADEAVSAGLAHEVAKDTKPTKKAKNAWNLSAFEKAPVAALEPDPVVATDDEHSLRIRQHAARMASRAA